MCLPQGEPAATALMGVGGARGRTRCKPGFLLSSVTITALPGVKLRPKWLEQAS